MPISAGSIPCPPFISDERHHRLAITQWMMRVSPLVTETLLPVNFVTNFALSASSANSGATIVGFDSTGTSLSATTVQSAILALSNMTTNGITAASLSATAGASVVGFNSTGTSLSATTVQSAINALNVRDGTFITAASLSATAGASVIGFDSSGTSLSATTVQSAFNAVVNRLPSIHSLSVSATLSLTTANVYSLLGSGTVTTVLGGWPGRTIYLLTNENITTFAHSTATNGLYLSAQLDMSASANVALNLVHNGTFWIQTK